MLWNGIQRKTQKWSSKNHHSNQKIKKRKMLEFASTYFYVEQGGAEDEDQIEEGKSDLS